MMFFLIPVIGSILFATACGTLSGSTSKDLEKIEKKRRELAVRTAALLYTAERTAQTRARNARAEAMASVSSSAKQLIDELLEESLRITELRPTVMEHPEVLRSLDELSEFYAVKMDGLRQMLLTMEASHTRNIIKPLKASSSMSPNGSQEDNKVKIKVYASNAILNRVEAVLDGMYYKYDRDHERLKVKVRGNYDYCIEAAGRALSVTPRAEIKWD